MSKLGRIGDLKARGKVKLKHKAKSKSKNKKYALIILLEAFRSVKRGRKKIDYYDKCMKYSKRASNGKTKT